MKNGKKPNGKKVGARDAAAVEVAALRRMSHDYVRLHPGCTAEQIAGALGEENRGRLGRVLRKLRETKHIRGKGTTRAMVYTATLKGMGTTRAMYTAKAL